MGAVKNGGAAGLYAAEDAHYTAMMARGNLTPIERAELRVWREGKALRGARASVASFEAEAERELGQRPPMVAAKDKQ